MKLSDIKPKTPEQQLALDNCILLIRTGSHLYGTSTPNSDNDFVGVFVQPKKYVLGKHRIEQVEFNTNPSDSGKPNQKGDFDCTIFAIDKWLTMCANNNPNRLEVFFAPKNCLVHVTEMGQRLLDSIDLFISTKCYHSFRGYSHEQMARMKLKSGNNTGRKDLQAEFGYDVKLAHHNIRLYLECIQLLKEGKIDFPLQQSKMLLDIKRGLWTIEDFYKKSEELSALTDAVYATSTLKHSPDHEAISELQIDLYEKHWV